MKAACVWESVYKPDDEDSGWASEIWDGRVAMIVEWSRTEEEAIAYLKEHYPDFPILPWQEFQEGWRKDIGNPKAKLFGDGTFKPKPKSLTSVKDSPKTYSSKLQLEEGETADTLVAPVAMAKRLGLPPQYVYQAISKGRIPTVGDRPKKARIADYATAYRKEVIPYGAVPPTGDEK